MIPTGIDYEMTARGRAPKLVACEECSLEYIYFVDRIGVGEDSSFLFLDNEGARDRAAEKARERLQANLAEACEPVPCPACGRVQRHTFRRARRLRRRWMNDLALLLFPLGVTLMMAAAITTGFYQKTPTTGLLIAIVVLWVLAAATLPPGIVLPLWKFFGNLGYDPNSEDVEARKQRGRLWLAIPRVECEKRLADATRPEQGPGDPHSQRAVGDGIVGR